MTPGAGDPGRELSDQRIAAVLDIELECLGRKDQRLDVPGIYMWTTTFDGTNYAQGAAIGILMLISVAILVVPYLVSSMRAEAEL